MCCEKRQMQFQRVFTGKVHFSHVFAGRRFAKSSIRAEGFYTFRQKAAKQIVWNPRVFTFKPHVLGRQGTFLRLLTLTVKNRGFLCFCMFLCRIFCVFIVKKRACEWLPIVRFGAHLFHALWSHSITRVFTMKTTKSILILYQTRRNPRFFTFKARACWHQILTVFLLFWLKISTLHVKTRQKYKTTCFHAAPICQIPRPWWGI